MEPEAFEKLIGTVLEAERGPARKRTVGVMYPSEAFGCTRRVYWDYVDPLPAGEALAKYGWSGRVFEHEIINLVLAGESIARYKVKGIQRTLSFQDAETGLMLRGRGDTFIELEVDGVQMVLEYKSTTHVETKAEKGWIPAKGDLAQLQCYLNMRGLQAGILAYFDRGDMTTKAYKVQHEPAEMLKILQWFRRLHHNVLHRTLPELEEIPVGCEKCRYGARCFPPVRIEAE